MEAHLPVEGRDELATLARELNRSISTLAELLDEIKNTGQTLYQTSESLHWAAGRHQRAEPGELADSAEDASQTAGQVRQRSQELQVLAGRLNTLVGRFRF